MASSSFNSFVCEHLTIFLSIIGITVPIGSFFKDAFPRRWRTPEITDPITKVDTRPTVPK